jgi:hypothetical protein
MNDGAKIGILLGMAFFASTAMDLVSQAEHQKKQKVRAKRKSPEVKPKKKNPVDDFITELVETKPGVWEKQRV